MNVMVLDVNQGAWRLETERGVVMDGDKAEHLLEAIPVMGSYCDVIGVRSFAPLPRQGRRLRGTRAGAVHPLLGTPGLLDGGRHAASAAKLRRPDYHRGVQDRERPKVVMTWAPHPNALPQAVPNSFAEWMNAADYDFVITHPEGYELDPAVRRHGPRRIRPAQSARRGGFRLCHRTGRLCRPTDYGKVLSPRPELDGGRRKDGAHPRRLFHALPARAAQHDRHGRSDRIAALAGDPRGRQPRDLGTGSTQKGCWRG